MKDISILKFCKADHQREKFDCGVDILNSYLKTRMNQEQNKRLLVGYVAVYKKGVKKNQIIGYYTLSNSSIFPSLVKSHIKHIPPTYVIPSVKLGRFAVDLKYQQQGIGKGLIKDAFLRVIELSLLSGVKMLEVFAKNDAAINFYEKYGFIQAKGIEHLLFLPIETIISGLKEVE